ncbi:DUF2591 family protein [Xenorhabdus sp. PR6a]|uniref:phage protein NinX family protein n=1 Tax=Xenorhabdus sp. PR6a TaxID=3025877 RepID=UPI00235928B0|nr:phage protein NinX family protein [Xenorhabdus sp. PR6a]MDC9582770.1 DUF2591 family protein [Xenorhabdus sp. PR6a]
MKLKTNELIGRALDFSVAKAIGMDIYICGRASDDEDGWIGNYNVTVAAFEKPVITVGFCGEICVESQAKSQKYSPSTNWKQCGQLIDKYCKSFGLVQDGTGKTWRSFAYGKPVNGIDMMMLSSGDSIQIAFCRALVTAMLGDEIDIPDELLEGE